MPPKMGRHSHAKNDLRVNFQGKNSNMSAYMSAYMSRPSWVGGPFGNVFVGSKTCGFPIILVSVSSDKVKLHRILVLPKFICMVYN